MEPSDAVPMTLPDFIIAGAQKSGTTWLARRLSQHPELFLPGREIHFFDKRFNYRRGLDWYESHFEESEPGQVVGEKTPDYIWVSEEGAEGHMPDIPRRLRRTLPDVKLLFILRDPVERAISAARHIVTSGRVAPWHSLADLLVGEERSRLRGHGVIDYGRYHRHLQAYLDCFDGDQILVLIFEEDVVDDPETGLRKACCFLGVDDDYTFEATDEVENPGDASLSSIVLRWIAREVPMLGRVDRLLPGLGPEWAPSVSEATRVRLTELYREDNERLVQLLGRDISAWRG